MTVEVSTTDSNHSIDAIVKIEEVDQSIERAIHDKNWFGRVARGYDALGKKKGMFAETAAVAASFVGTLFLGGLAFASAWGAYEMSKDCVVALVDGDRPPADIGHSAEWSAQVIIYSYFYFRQLHKVAAEGDYYKVQKIFMNVFKNREISIANLPAVYHYVLQTMKSLTSGGVIHRSLILKTAKSIELVNDNAVVGNLEAPLERDYIRRMQEIFMGIQSDLNRELSTKNFFRRSWEGIKSIYHSHGKTGVAVATLTGVALPVIFGFQSILSIIGTGFVIDDLMNHDEDISVIGHVGEWPVNAFAFLYMGYKLNQWSITSEGDLTLAKNVIQSHWNKHSQGLNEQFRNLFIQTGNDELQHIASKCMFTSAPSSYLLKESND